MPTLERLDADNGKFSDSGMKYIGALTSLRQLNLVDCANITYAGLNHLGQLKNLDGLNLHMTPVTDDGLRHLAGLTKLEGLTLSRTKVTDAGLAHLATLVNLKYLDLGGTETTDAGLVHLRGLKKLHIFRGGVGVTRDGLIELKKYAPRLRVPRESASRSGSGRHFFYSKTSGDWLPGVAVITLLAAQPLVGVTAKSCCRTFHFEESGNCRPDADVEHYQGDNDG